MPRLVHLKPFPDELAEGYLGRLSRINALGDRRQTLRQMGAYLGVSTLLRHCPAGTLLGLMAKMPTEDLVNKHTLCPLVRAVTPERYAFVHGSEQHVTALARHTVSLVRPSVHACASCVREQREHEGIARWQRRHQLLGLYACPVHEVAFAELENSNAAFATTPDEAFVHGREVPRALVQATFDPYVQRFLAMQEFMLTLRRPLNSREVRARLRARRSALGLKHSSTSLPLVEELHHFPLEWLRNVAPVLFSSNESSMTRVRRLYGLQSGNQGALHVLLAATVLYPTAQEAINAFLQCLPLNGGETSPGPTPPGPLG